MEGLKGPDHIGIAIIFPQEYQRQQWKLNIVFSHITDCIPFSCNWQIAAVELGDAAREGDASALRAPRTQDK